MITRIFPAGKRRCDTSLNAPVGVDFKTGVRSSRVEYKEGIKAKRIVVSSVTPRVKPSTRAWFESAKNYALYANQGGFYDDVLDYLGMKK